MIFTKPKLLICLFLIFNFFILKNSYALESLSYSGRLVQSNGAPVTTSPNLKIDLAYTGSTSGTVRCSQNFTSVPLTNGVFHLKLNLNCGTYGTLTDVLSVVPAGESAAIRVTDLSNAKVYSYQAIHSMPFANVAAQLVQMNATNGQVLTWNEGQKKWKAETLAGGGGGTVTTVSGTLPISVANGLVTPVVSISQATTSTDGYLSSADWNTFNSKQGTLPAGGTSAHYYRGDNSWQTLDTSIVPENTNLYFTNARALGVPLAGFTTATGAIVATDTAIEAFGKTQGQINSLVTDSSKYLIKNNTDSITGVVNVGTIGLLQLVYTPVGMNDATNKSYVDSEVGTKVSKTGDTISGVLTLDNDLKIKGGSNHVTVKGHAASANYNLFLPQTAGTAGYVLSTDGIGNTSWVTPAVGSSSITDGSIVDDDINASAAIAQSKIAGLATDLSNKQSLITAGTTAQYYRGDKTFVDLGTDVRATVLTGFSAGANTAILATDTTIGAFQKIQGQIDATNTAVAGKESSLTAGSTSQYYRGDKSWQILDGSVVANTAAGTIAATNVQSALNELDSEKQDKLTSASIVDSRELRFYELPGNGTFYSSLKSPDDLTANINYVLPVVAPTAGQVLSSSAAGVMSWITIPIAPVATVHGRSGAVVAANGDYAASQITNVPAGSIVATDVQVALNELDSEKEPLLTNPSDTTKYYRGDKTWSTFATDAINSVLSTFALNAGAKPAVANTDSVVGAFGKVQKYINDINTDYVSKSADNTVTGSFNLSGITSFIQVPTPSGAVVNEAANVQYVQNYVGGFCQWTKTGSDIYRNGGNVGIGTTAPMTSSLLELSSTTKGFSPPRMTLAQRNAIVSPTQGLVVFNTTDNTLDYYNGSTWLALNGSAKYMKLMMSANQTVDSGSSVAFDTIAANSGMTRSGNGIQLKAGVTYRLEAAINTLLASGSNYLGYAFHNGSTFIGGSAYTDEGENTLHGFKAGLLEIYKPSADEVVSVRISDDNIGTGQVTSNYNTYLIATEIVPSGPAGGGTDNLGNHIVSQNLVLGSNWLTGDGGAEGIRIDASGYVGIGTSTPTNPLTVIGSSSSLASIWGGNSNATGIASMGYNSSTGAYGQLGAGSYSGIFMNGNVGIGNTSPSTKLHISKSVSGEATTVDEIALRISNPIQAYGTGGEYAQTGISFGRDDSTRGAIVYGTYGLDYMDFYTADSTLATPRMRLTATGNLGIGTLTPGIMNGWTANTAMRLFEIAGDGSANGNADGIIVLSNNRATPATGDQLGAILFSSKNDTGGIHSAITAYNTGTGGVNGFGSDLSFTTKADNVASTVTRVLISSTGNVGIGTTNPGYKLDVNGTIRGYGITDSSDIRLKNEIKPLTNDLEKINKLQGVSYYWKDQEKHDDKKQIGLIAQAVEKIYPELVSTDKEGMKSVNYSHMVSPLIEAVKSLYNKVLSLDDQLKSHDRKIASKADKAETDALRAENAKLKKENEIIKARLDKIEKALNSK